MKYLFGQNDYLLLHPKFTSSDIGSERRLTTLISYNRKRTEDRVSSTYPMSHCGSSRHPHRIPGSPSNTKPDSRQMSLICRKTASFRLVLRSWHQPFPESVHKTGESTTRWFSLSEVSRLRARIFPGELYRQMEAEYKDGEEFLRVGGVGRQARIFPSHNQGYGTAELCESRTLKEGLSYDSKLVRM